MNRPSWPIYALGNAPIAAAVVLLGLVLLCRWFAGLDDLGAAIVGGALVGAASKARRQLMAYRRWEQAWNAMEGKPPTQSFVLLRRLVGVVLIAGIAAYFYERSDEPESRFALIWLGVGLTVVILVAVARPLRRAWSSRAARRGAKTDVVRVSIGAPLLKVPPLSVAYQRLPAHCLPLLSGRQEPARHDTRTDR